MAIWGFQGVALKAHPILLAQASDRLPEVGSEWDAYQANQRAKQQKDAHDQCLRQCMDRMQSCLPTTNQILGSGAAGIGASREMASRMTRIFEQCKTLAADCRARC